MPQHLTHEFPPFFHKDSEVLFLGSFPSVKSREQQFYYGHPQNRFWKVMTILYEGRNIDRALLADYRRAEEILTELGCPRTREEKAAFAKRHHMAMWDVIDSCTIEGSSDSSIRDVVVNDLSVILPHSGVEKICVNGTAAWKLFERYMLADALRLSIARENCVKLPSTSPANAAWSLPRLLEAWEAALRD
ncbi:MAG: DNA-deoxyinosine glycosylase [Lachnospiraceae bacterium]|nr:DNA-deoxyinosine glycosylase [Lachnospiraceae bacterium]